MPPESTRHVGMGKNTMTITHQQERFTNIIDELPPLFVKHWEEVIDDRDVIPLAPDWQGMLQADAAGGMHIMTMRDDGKLVGYCCGLTIFPMHYSTTLHGIVDMIYLLPEYRKGLVGSKLLDGMENIFRALQVKKVYILTKIQHDLAALLKRKGYTPEETSWSKLL